MSLWYNDYNNNENQVNNTDAREYRDAFIKYVCRKYTQRRKSPEINLAKNIITLSALSTFYRFMLGLKAEKIHDRNLINFNQQISMYVAYLCKLKIMQLQWLDFLNIKNE